MYWNKTGTYFNTEYKMKKWAFSQTYHNLNRCIYYSKIIIYCDVWIINHIMYRFNSIEYIRKSIYYYVLLYLKQVMTIERQQVLGTENISLYHSIWCLIFIFGPWLLLYGPTRYFPFLREQYFLWIQIFYDSVEYTKNNFWNLTCISRVITFKQTNNKFSVIMSV